MAKIVPMNVAQASHALVPSRICVTTGNGRRVSSIVKVSFKKLSYNQILYNSFSILDLVVHEIHDYCIEHKMKLDPKKCKEMYIHRSYEEFGYRIGTHKCWI